MEQYYKPYVSDSSDSESDSDGYTSEESLVNIPGKRPPVPTGGPGVLNTSQAPPENVGTKFESQEYKNTNLITINSRDRDTSIYPQPTFFTLRLPKVFKNVKTINLSQLNLLNSFFNFSASAGNTFLYVQEQGRQPIKISIRDGTYTASDLVEELNSALNTTPLFADITFGAFISGFQSTGDFAPLFNVPGAVVYNSLIQKYEVLQSINDIIARYFVQEQSVGTVSFNYNKCLVAYYYPVLKEMVLQLPNPGLTYSQTTFPTYNDFYTYIVFYFEGLTDSKILEIVSNAENQALMDDFRYKNTFNYFLVNKYNCVYNTKQGRLVISAPGLDVSISNDLTSNYNYFLNQAILSNGSFADSNDFYNQYYQISNANAALIGFYNFIQQRYTSSFGVSLGTYAAEFYADPNSLIQLYNTSNKYGWYPYLNPNVSENQIFSNPQPQQQTILWSNIIFPSTLYRDTDFISTCFSTNNLTFSNAGEDTYGYFDVVFPIYPTSYQRLSWISPVRQNLSIMTIPRYENQKTSTNDMVFNLGPTTTPKLYDLMNPPNTYIRTDISGNILFNMYTCSQNMFDSADYMRTDDKWLTYMIPQILAGQRLQPSNPNYGQYPPINDINITSYRPFIYFEVVADQYLVDPNAHFNITFYVETQSDPNNPTPLGVPIVIVAYKDRAAFMADIQSDLSGQIGIENPNHYFQKQTYDADVTSAQLTIDVNNNQHVFFHVHIQNDYNIPSEIPLRVFALLTDPYGTFREKTRLDTFDLPFVQSSISTQVNPTSLIAGTLPSIFSETVTQIGYDINNVSNNLLDYVIRSGSNYYDPINITDYIENVSTGLRYQFTLQNNGSPQPPPDLSNWSLFFGSNSSNVIRDTYNTSNQTDNIYLSNGVPLNPLPQGGMNEYIMTNWFSPTNLNNPERFWTPNSNNNYVEYIGQSSIFLSASNSPPLVTDSVTSSFSGTSYVDLSGFSGFGFYLPPNQVVRLTDLVIKFAYTQPSVDPTGTLFTRDYSPLQFTGQVYNECFYRNQTTFLDTETYEKWDDWYSKNRRNMKIGIFLASRVQNMPINSIRLESSITTLSLIQITQVNNYRDGLGTLKTREPDWGTYYRYKFTQAEQERFVPNYDVWSTGVVSSFTSIQVSADFGPSNYTVGSSTFNNYFATNPSIFNYTYLPRSYGLAPSVANAIANPTVISTIDADIPASYVAIPFYFEQGTSTYKVGCYHGITFTFEPALPSTNVTGASPFYGPLGPFGWTNTNNVLSLMSTGNKITTYYWNAKLLWNTLEDPYNPATDLSLFGNYDGVSQEYQNTMLFVYKNTISNTFQDYRDVLSSAIWRWGQEKKSNYIALDSNSGYNNLSYIQNIPVQANTEYAIHVRSYDPIPSFTTGARIIGKGFTDFGIVSLTDVASEISDLSGYHPITEEEANLFNSQLQNGLPSGYNAIVSTNYGIRFANNHKYSIQYANTLINFDKLFSTTVTFGKTENYTGITYTFRGYGDAISTYIGSFSQTRGLLSTYNVIFNSALINLDNYIQTRYKTILPSSVSKRSRYTDPLPFSLLFSTYTLPPYSYQYDEWGLGYNLGFNKVDTPIRTTVTSDTFIRIVQSYIYLRISPELNTNTMAVSGKESLADCRESGGQDAKFFSKILLNDFGSFSQTAVQRPKEFNPVLGKYETMTCQLTDKYGNQINNVDCEYDFVLQIDEITNGPKDNSSLLGPTSDLNVYRSAK